MPLVKPSYVRSHYTGSEEQHDSLLAEYILLVQGEIESILGQPVEARSVTYTFTGAGKQSVTLPHTVKPVLVTLETRAAVGQAWTAVTGAAILAGTIELAEGFVEGQLYRATLTVGLSAYTGEAELSTDFTANGRYRQLLTVLCEMVTVKFMESHRSNFGNRTFALAKLAESTAGQITRSYEYKDMTRRWVDMLGPYKRLRVW